ncbi:gluconokinase [Motiliproteus sp. MSK22-1]|uniref:gluconokinase n=1 Tax=Motiliproteus sp. MSK22-1 TaxID=1897630 RepID=UPI0011800CD4|nr:gluconokinase [Motiliproteus sp. MSK22-1]
MNIIVMGVSGCGKSTVGKMLAEVMGIEFLEGDAFHPQDNISRMTAGVPLTDSDRSPWLRQLSAMVSERQGQQRDFVLACSALKKSYRQQLARGAEELIFVYLKGSRTEIYKRMAEREDHFMALSLADSQFEALEEPDQDENSITVSIDNPVQQIVDQIARAVEQRHDELG